VVIALAIESGLCVRSQTGLYLRVPQTWAQTVKDEVLSWIPKSNKLSYPVLMPNKLDYQFSLFGFFTMKVTASDIKAANIEMNASELDIDFMTNNIPGSLK
jgi:hypothetical protein